MKQKTKKTNVSKNKPLTHFTIDLDMKGMILFLILVALTAITVFYLGMIFGKASRDPNRPAVSSKSVAKISPAEEKEIEAKDLEIFNMHKESDRISNLKKDTDSVLGKVDQMLANSKQDKSESQSVVLKPEKQKPPVKSEEIEPGKQWPDDLATLAKNKDLFTVQVFATKDKDKADKIIKQLRKKAFNAYLTEATIEGKKIYRVRVGRRSKDRIVKLKEDLEKIVGGMGMKSRIVQLK